MRRNYFVGGGREGLGIDIISISSFIMFGISHLKKTLANIDGIVKKKPSVWDQVGLWDQL